MDVRALTFDVFGTLLDWRSTVASALRESGLEVDRQNWSMIGEPALSQLPRR